MILLAALLQAAGPPADYVRKLSALDECAPTARRHEGEDIVICAKSDSAYRLKPLPPNDDFASAVRRAETKVLGNTKLSGETEAASVGGFVSNRAMVRLKVPF